MKHIPRTIPMFFLLFGLVVLALPAPAAAAPRSPFPPIRADQASANKGQNVIVQGVVTSERANGRQGYYINLDSTGPSPIFAGYIRDENLKQFPPLESLDGHTVTITGMVQMREGYPIIIMTNASQLRIVR